MNTGNSRIQNKFPFIRNNNPINDAARKFITFCLDDLQNGNKT